MPIELISYHRPHFKFFFICWTISIFPFNVRTLNYQANYLPSQTEKQYFFIENKPLINVNNCKLPNNQHGGGDKPVHYAVVVAI